MERSWRIEPSVSSNNIVFEKKNVHKSVEHGRDPVKSVNKAKPPPPPDDPF